MTDTPVYEQIISSMNTPAKTDKHLPVSLEYLNDAVKATYDTMRNGIISHVTMKVALSLFNLAVDGFAPENIATYVSDGTKPFLPFEFANGVKITKVTAKGGTIVYRAEMPITKVIPVILDPNIVPKITPESPAKAPIIEETNSGIDAPKDKIINPIK